jgi:tRNA (mo5U34)-methyltransferase
VPTALGRDALLVDKTWSAQEIATYQATINAAAGPSGYYHQYLIRDRSGQTLTSPGVQPCIRALPSLERFGFPTDLTGKTVLDIGCNAGFYSFAAKLRGAKSVLGLDFFPHCVEQSRIFRDILDIDVEFRQADGENLVPEDIGTFDVVIDMGVIYHLQNPMRFLSNMARLTREYMLLETAMLTDPKLTDYAWFIEHTYCGDGSNWWIYGPECTRKMVRAAGFARADFNGFVWKPSWSERKTPEGFKRQGRGMVLCRK